MSIESEETEKSPVNNGRRVFSVSFKDVEQSERLYNYVKFRVNKGLSKDRASALIDLLNEVETNPLVFFKTK